MCNNKVETFRITTHMGKVQSYFGHPMIDVLNDNEIMELDEIGYRGKMFNGVKTTREAYLNSLNKGTFYITQTKLDSGDFYEKFLVTRTSKMKTQSVKPVLIDLGPEMGVSLSRDVLKSISHIYIEKYSDKNRIILLGQNFVHTSIQSMTLEQANSLRLKIAQIIAENQ